jgi:hypothetical protein
MEDKYYWSAKESGFYLESMKALYEDSPDGWPVDAVEITEELYNSLLAGQLNGKVITSDSNGNPILTDPVIDWSQKAESQRQSLLTAAKDTIADWKIELQLETISDDDKASLINWMAYIKALKALDFSGVTDEGGYKAIVWPDKPE